MKSILKTSKQKHFIISGSDNAVKGDSLSSSVGEKERKITRGLPVGSTRRYNFSKESKDEFKKIAGVPNSDFTTVVHEMQHQYDFDQANMKNSYNKTSSATNPAEIRAVITENIARSIEELPWRTKYGGIEMILKN